MNPVSNGLATIVHINFTTFNSYTGGTNVWEVVLKPPESKPPEAGAPR